MLELLFITYVKKCEQMSVCAEQTQMLCSTFLKAKPSTAIFLPEMVLNMASITRSTKRCFW